MQTNQEIAAISEIVGEKLNVEPEIVFNLAETGTLAGVTTAFYSKQSPRDEVEHESR